MIISISMKAPQGRAGRKGTGATESVRAFQSTYYVRAGTVPGPGERTVSVLRELFEYLVFIFLSTDAQWAYCIPFHLINSAFNSYCREKRERSGEIRKGNFDT